MAFDLIKVWWRAGEENATAVYRLGFRRLFVELIVVYLLIGLCWAFVPQRWIIVGAAMWTLFRMLAEGRRAIIFRPDAITYRPPLLSPRTIRVGDISRVQEGRVWLTFNGFARPRAGVNLMLKDGDAFGIPLDFPDREEILRRIKLAVGTGS